MNEDVQAKIEKIKRRARDNFSSGYKCSECVTEAVWAIIDTGLPSDAWKLATGFGGGIGLYGDTCGALTGAVLAVGSAYGRSTLLEGEDRRDTITKSRKQLYEEPGLYRVFNRIPNWFVECYGDTICRELTAPWHSDWLCREHALYCREIITETAGLAAELMLLTADELAAFTFGIVVEQLEEPPSVGQD